MDDLTKAKWQSLVDQFNLRKPGADPWDALLLQKQFNGASHGEKCTISFLLNVWSPNDPWECGTFDLIDAYATWDDDHRTAFLSWDNRPWWP